MTWRKTRSVVAWIVLAVVASALPGCGTGEYNSRLERKVKDLKSRSPFATLAEAPVDIAGSPFALRPPKDMQAVPAGADPKQLKIPFAPDLTSKLTYEGSLADANGNQRLYYCYVFILPIPATPQDPTVAMVETLRQKLEPGKELAGVPTTPVDCAAPDGASTSWFKVRFTGSQEFLVKDKTGKLLPAVKEDGVIEVWSHRDNKAGGIVALAWRVPKAIEGPDRVNLDELAPRVAGGVTVK
jgi:hypothetical protein